MKTTMWIGMLCAAAICLWGFAATGTMGGVSSQPDAPAAWDDSPPAPGEGKDHAPMAPLPTDKAIAIFGKRVEKNPEDAFALTVLGRLHLRRAKATGNIADTREAVELLRRATKSDPTYSAPPLFLAIALQEQHKFKESLELAEEVLRLEPRSTLALAIKGDAQLELGRYEQA